VKTRIGFGLYNPINDTDVFLSLQKRIEKAFLIGELIKAEWSQIFGSIFFGVIKRYNKGVLPL